MSDIPASKKTRAVVEGFDDSFEGDGTFSGRLETAGDHDWVRVELDAGVNYLFSLCFLKAGSTILGDALLRLRGPNGSIVGQDNDGGTGQNSLLFFTPQTSGTYFIDIGAVGNKSKGEYSLFVKAGNASGNFPNLSDGDDVATAFTGYRALGGKGNDQLTVGSGATDVVLLGEQGNDVLTGDADTDILSGGIGLDFLDGGDGADRLFGDAGNDVIIGGDPDSGLDLGDTIFGGAGNDMIDGVDGNDSIFGGTGNDDIDGGNRDDTIFGGTGNDTINGGDGVRDKIFGGKGKDFLTGGAGFDEFGLQSLADSPRGAGRDVITDFVHASGDVIRLNLLDAKTHVAGDQAFTFIGSTAFHDKKGELQAVIDATNNRTIVQGDVDGDGKADFQIELTGQIALDENDFFL